MTASNIYAKKFILVCGCNWQYGVKEVADVPYVLQGFVCERQLYTRNWITSNSK
jgi:hypothetical protein